MSSRHAVDARGDNKTPDDGGEALGGDDVPLVMSASHAPREGSQHPDAGSSPIGPGGFDSEGDYHPPKRLFTMPQLVALFACSFSYAFVFNTINNIVIPKEIERLASSRQSVWVGLIMAAGALSQLATPVVGAWSDRAGHRTSFLIYGTFVTIIGVVLFLATATINDMLMLFCAHVLTSVGLSMQYAMVTALLNDHVCEEQVGRGSGVMAVLAIVGSGAGYAMFAVGVPLYYSYCSYILASVLCLGVCVWSVPTAPTNDSFSRRPRSNSLGPAQGYWRALCSDAVGALSIPSPRKHSDFFFACVGRALFNTGLAGQVYLVYYFRDVLGADNPTQLASVVAVMALFGGIVGALPAGVISDRVGKKPVIYWSISLCIVALGLFMSVRTVGLMQLTGFLYGVGNVAYLSVDYALGVQSLPRRQTSDGRRSVPIDAAKDLGVFAMSATVGQLFGQMVNAGVLEQFSVVSPNGFVTYSHMGFIAAYGSGAACFALAGVATRFIRGVK